MRSESKMAPKSSTRKILIVRKEEEPHQQQQQKQRLRFVCGCKTALTFFLSSLLFTFSDASSDSSSPTNPPTLSPFKTHQGFHFDHKLFILLITLSCFFASLFLIMALFKCFGFKLKRTHNRVGATTSIEAVADVEEGSEVNDKKGGDDGFGVRKFSWDEIARFTNNFSTVIGSGGYSTVYLAHSPDSGHRFWAIKIHNGSERLHQVFRKELDILLRLGHRSIVKLLGYCDDRDEGALVFEYIPNGTLQEILHGGDEADRKSILSWKNRMLIAYEVAQAIEYLHEKCDLQIVHMDIKASNVLLDEKFNSKLCDFGSAKMGFSATVKPPSPALKKQFLMMGSPGYTDPHYMRTGFASKKNDVYSFGVLLLELVTGMEAFSPEKGRLLTSAVGSRVVESGGCFETAEEVAGVVDSRLGGFDVEEARVMLTLAATCLRQSPTLRPSVSQILRTITDGNSSVSSEIREESDRYDSVK